MAKTSIKKLIEAKCMLGENNFHKSFYLDFFIVKVIESKGKTINQNLDGYTVYGVPKERPTRFIIAEGIKRQRVIGEMSAEEVLIKMKEILPPTEYHNWLEYNLGILDVLTPILNDDLKGYRSLITNFINDPHKKRLDKILPNSKYDHLIQLKISQKVLESKHRQLQKMSSEKADLEIELKKMHSEIERLENQITKQKRRNICDEHQKTLLEVMKVQ